MKKIDDFKNTRRNNILHKTKKLVKRGDTNMKRNEIEKIEVEKNNGNFYYTGILQTDSDPDWVTIKTVRGEELKFRKEQIMQRRTVDTIGDDTNERKRNKNIPFRE